MRPPRSTTAMALGNNPAHSARGSLLVNQRPQSRNAAKKSQTINWENNDSTTPRALLSPVSALSVLSPLTADSKSSLQNKMSDNQNSCGASPQDKQIVVVDNSHIQRQYVKKVRSMESAFKALHFELNEKNAELDTMKLQLNLCKAEMRLLGHKPSAAVSADARQQTSTSEKEQLPTNALGVRVLSTSEQRRRKHEQKLHDREQQLAARHGLVVEPKLDEAQRAKQDAALSRVSLERFYRDATVQVRISEIAQELYANRAMLTQKIAFETLYDLGAAIVAEYAHPSRVRKCMECVSWEARMVAHNSNMMKMQKEAMHEVTLLRQQSRTQLRELNRLHDMNEKLEDDLRAMHEAQLLDRAHAKRDLLHPGGAAGMVPHESRIVFDESASCAGRDTRTEPGDDGPTFRLAPTKVPSTATRVRVLVAHRSLRAQSPLRIVARDHGDRTSR